MGRIVQNGVDDYRGARVLTAYPTFGLDGYMGLDGAGQLGHVLGLLTPRHKATTMWTVGEPSLCLPNLAHGLSGVGPTQRAGARGIEVLTVLGLPFLPQGGVRG
jgi:hypothetical protein